MEIHISEINATKTMEESQTVSTKGKKKKKWNILKLLDTSLFMSYN